jgi:phosphate transport system substrate-binding protein
MPSRRALVSFGLLALCLPLASGCGGCSRSPRVNAGGATFVDPIMQRWSGEYKRLRDVEIDYVKSGSGQGVQQMTARTIDFGCTDAPMKKGQLDEAKAKGGEVVHVPLVMGAVAVVYNLPEVQSPLKLTGPVIADIYLGKVAKWDDPAIAGLNPGVALPDRDITPVYRAEASGTSNIFTEYLSKTSPEFKARVGATTDPKWPEGRGTGQKGNDGVAGHVKNNPGTIGYVESLYAKRNGLPTALVRNRAGEFLAPETDAVTAAAAEAMREKPAEEPYSLHELTYSLTDAAGAKSYPVCGISYAVLYTRQPKDKGPVIVEFLKWATTDGQQFAKELEYAPLPDDLRKKVQERLGQVTFE